jgi:hypothetical protein
MNRPAPGWRLLCTALLVSAGLAASAAPAWAQGSLPIEIGGLLRTGLRIESEESGHNDGFQIFDAQASLGGKVGIVFDYFVRAAFSTEDNTLRLLDVTARIPFIPEAGLGIGMFRPSFGLEALQDEGDFTFLRRSQASAAIAPGRQIGAEFYGGALETRLTYGAGIFNGNGRTLENDDNRFMYAARVEYNSIGPIEFYNDLVIQVGGSIAYSQDSNAPLGTGLITPPAEPPCGDPPEDGCVPPPLPVDREGYAGKRLLYGADVYLSYRGFSVTAEYLRGDYEPDDPVTEAGKRDAYGGYVEAGYSGFGVVEGVVRYDGFHPAAGDNRDFIVFGVNIFPGYYAKLGVQYAVGLHGSRPSPTLADGQFVLLVQVDF